MIETSAEYKIAVYNDERRWVPKVEVYFDGDEKAPTIFEGDDIAIISSLEEEKADFDNPLGLVTANEIDVTFDNSDRKFTPTNNNSPYYSKLKPNILIKPYLGLLLPDESLEYIPLGVYRTGDWRTPSMSVEATVTAYDRLYALGELSVPMLPVAVDINIGKLFKVLFDALGLGPDEYYIDPTLNQRVSIGWFPQGKARDAFQTLAVAGKCSINVDRYGVIRVKNNFSAGSHVAVLTDDNQIISVENPQRYLDIYSAVRINYSIPYIKESESILKVENLKVPNGGIAFEVAFNNGPVYSVEQISLIGARNATIEEIKYGAWAVAIRIRNHGAAEVVNLEAIGRVVDKLDSTYNVQDDDAVVEFGLKELTISNYLIQNEDVARTYGNALIQYVTDPSTNFKLSVRGDPALEVGDIIQISNDIDKIGTKNIRLSRINLDYDGGLSAGIEARKPVVPYYWCFIGPGLFAYVPRSL